MKKILVIGLLIQCLNLTGQEQPKLVVGVIVDQMRTDYIYRYWHHYSEGGFKRLINEGFFCKNAHFDYIPTYTGPGHASVYTGTTPMVHGIIANNWYDKHEKKKVYCASDENYLGVGIEAEQKAGKMAPTRLLVPTLGDMIRTASLFKGKSIGISIKDRGAILPAGHSANAAYWMDYNTGKMISSSYYVEKLPKWVEKFNNEKPADKLAKEGWDLLLAESYYAESTADDTPYEKLMAGKETPTFPYDMEKAIREDSYYSFAKSPLGNTYLRKFAHSAIINEDLGADDHTDLLAISFSSPDMIGHAYGPQSREIQDTYLRLDLEIEQLLNELDERVGKGAYTLFLTADHAGAQVPSYLKDNKIPVDYFDEEKFEETIDKALLNAFGEGEWIESYSNQQFFFNHALLEEKSIDVEEVSDLIEKTAKSFNGVANTLSTIDMETPLPPDHFSVLAQNGWNPLRSGDVIIQYLAGWMDYGPKGTTHGSSYAYDTHVPLLFMGFGVNQGVSYDEVSITQIAPTISIISSIAFPDASSHKVISEVIK